ncbi:uncharacterized protein RAG0_04794 [Rhynchosporium agropyri]|uniref:Uncharacterized protein n=1 Tax=Rhynchosporium agropyri TaxID=914238 RepID=A0A1E1KA88_9HELO|nr:uncharacterized protein RAG0_04794 [Rhynchosporium agropyri]
MSPISSTLYFGAKSFSLSSRDLVNQKRTGPIIFSPNIMDSTQKINMISDTAREHMIIAIFTGIIGFSFLSFLGYLLYRFFENRTRRMKELDIEEGRKEVTEAREIRPQDGSLKEGYFKAVAAPDGSIYVSTPLLQEAPQTTSSPLSTPAVILTRPSVESGNGVDTPPLFRPGIKRSRTISTQATQYSNGPSKGPISSPKSVDEQPALLRSNASTVSLDSYHRAESKTTTTFSTIQTQRPETPPNIPPKSARISHTPPPLNPRREIHSFWSMSDTASDAPTSPSIYSPTYQSDLAPRPASSVYSSEPVFHDPFKNSNTPIDAPAQPIYSISIAGTPPSLSYPLPLLLRNSPTSPGQPVLPFSPSLSPRMIAPIGPGSPEEENELPVARIQRWLSSSGSVGTTSIIESVLGRKRKSNNTDMYRSERLSRSARNLSISSLSSSEMGEEILIGAAF